ncbi:hypothetical protein CPB83DRAFT_850305 [Crepidotus variabilis]|uniref:Uncharacterized protein n=1 Tax=Crepidotus variabilis TaxID=179855 RepID=A0A9P6EJC9_9AGAR|nr:hypothetical protein CPB83DRAFT_850305 [Crepidotus variabilis]
MLSALFIATLGALASATEVQIVGRAQTSFPPGVIATGTMGPNNPPEPTLGTAINQTSMARLLTANTVDDWCIFAPPTPEVIGNSETYEVAYCTKPRNNARLIPDGTISGVSFLKTDFYVQIIGFGDLTKINIPYGDYGGELDPHGAYGSGNPIGGNVTSNITGSDQHFTEWMLYVSYQQFCFRICTNANSTYSAEYMCWHELDEVGCQFVMPGNYNINGTFESCEADVAYPPGWYPTATVNGVPQFSTFAQRYTGTLSNGQVYTVGDTVTPPAPYFTPSSSNCVKASTIANGVPYNQLGISGSGPSVPAQTGSGAGASGPSATGSSGASQPTKSNNGAAAQGVKTEMVLVGFWAVIAALGGIVMFA